ncbi:hypothetical protein D3C72_2071710 [compost metagenome]
MLSIPKALAAEPGPDEIALLVIGMFRLDSIISVPISGSIARMITACGSFLTEVTILNK